MSGEEIASGMGHVKVRLIISSPARLSAVVGQMPVISVDTLITDFASAFITFKDKGSHPLVWRLTSPPLGFPHHSCRLRRTHRTGIDGFRPRSRGIGRLCSYHFYLQAQFICHWVRVLVFLPFLSTPHAAVFRPFHRVYNSRTPRRIGGVIQLQQKRLMRKSVPSLVNCQTVLRVRHSSQIKERPLRFMLHSLHV